MKKILLITFFLIIYSPILVKKVVAQGNDPDILLMLPAITGKPGSFCPYFDTFPDLLAKFKYSGTKFLLYGIREADGTFFDWYINKAVIADNEDFVQFDYTFIPGDFSG